MNSAHDLGGMHGFGSINPEPEGEEPVFHAEWEKRVFGLTLAVATLGKWNIDMVRHARERQSKSCGQHDRSAGSYVHCWIDSKYEMTFAIRIATSLSDESSERKVGPHTGIALEP